MILFMPSNLLKEAGFLLPSGLAFLLLQKVLYEGLKRRAWAPSSLSWCVPPCHHLPVSDSSSTSVGSPVAALGPPRGHSWNSQGQVTLLFPLVPEGPESLPCGQHTSAEHLPSAGPRPQGPQPGGGGCPSRASLKVGGGEMSARAPAPGDR